jgi:hypothetical protein
MRRDLSTSCFLCARQRARWGFQLLYQVAIELAGMHIAVMTTQFTRNFCLSLVSTLLFTLCGCSRADIPEGMYLMTRMAFGSLETTGYYFQGNEIFEAPKGGDDFAAFKQANPKKHGTYVVEGDTMRVTWGGGRSATESKLEKKEKGCFYFNGGLFCPVQPFANETNLDGTYSGGGSAGMGTGAVVSSASSITFSKDGKYTASRVGGVSTESSRVSAGASATSSDSGTYEIAGYTLTLKSSSGSTTKVTAFPYEPDHLYYEGRMMKRQ